MLGKAKTDIDKFFNDLFQIQSKLKIDVIEDDESYQVLADVPGIKKENINIEYKDEILSIYVTDDTQCDKNYIKKERQCGFYQRSFNIPNVDFENSKATVNDGILTINLPKREIKKVSYNINIE